MRRATHSGSWYSDSGRELSQQLDTWLNEADVTHNPARAIIAPHAGYRYSGACSGFAYRQVNPDLVSRIFILGPSHHVSISGCALTNLIKYQTPLYDLMVDKTVNDELMKTGNFDYLDIDVDEIEHSIEMHLPYIAKVMERNKDNFTIVPVLVGTLSFKDQKAYGSIFANYLADSENLFVISSDFCHWGSRFQYTFVDESYKEIYKSIEALDRAGMLTIEKLDPTGFTNYLQTFGNTICGRYPIGILLESIQQIMRKNERKNFGLKFLKYAQSSQCLTMDDSSVSYASASLICK